MILLIFAVTMTVILVSALTAGPVYSAAVRLQVIPMEAEQVALYSPIRTTGADIIDLTAYQFMQTVRSGTIAWRTIAQLKLNTDAVRLLSRLRTEQDGEFVTVIVEADTPQDAEAIVTAQVDNALTAFRGDRARPAVVAGEFVAGQLTAAEQALAAAQAELLRFKLNHSVQSLDREITAYQDIVRDLRRGQENATLEVARLTARIRALEEEAAEAVARAAETRLEPVEGPKSDTEASALRQAAELRATIAALRGELAGQRGLQTEYDRAIAQWETDLTSLIGLSDEFTRLSTAVKQAQDTRDFLFNKALEAHLKQQQGLSVGYLKIVEPARRPDQPLPSRMLQIALLGGLLSLLVGGILAFLFEAVESWTRKPRGRRGRIEVGG
jgi:uncharacterized protein involved in exopolysaccharide biosynthesis